MILDFLEIERTDGVAIIWLDEKDRSVNTISPRALDALEQAFEEVGNDDRVRGVVIASRKQNSFVAGADLDVLRDATTPDEAAALSRRGHDMIRRVKTLKKPLVAAINGPALGGGLELALACDYRVATYEAPTRFGLPEVQLGLLPGGGGTQLLPRLIGLQEALPMMLTGKNVFPRKAKKLGLVDLLTHKFGLIQTAVRAAQDLADGSLKPDREKQLSSRLIDATPVGRKIVYKKALDQVEKETGGNYPAPPLIVECVRTGMEDGMDAGFRAESKNFGRLVFTPQHRALVGIFRAKQRGDKNQFEGARDVRMVGVLGAGLMGSGIAQVTAAEDIEVRMKDADFERAAAGQKSIYSALQKKMRRRQLRPFEVDTIITRIVPVDSYGPLANADIVIEAVPEDLDLKREVLADVEAITGPKAIFATNTSSIPISEIASGAKRPERVVGMHYFSPVPQRPLLEIVRKDDTPDEVLATVSALGLEQGKTLIVVRDGPGFYTTRILAFYLNEALILLEEGADAEFVDRAMKEWGFPMGPFELMDLVGLDVAAKITPVLASRMGDRDLPTSEAGGKMLDAGWHGQKSKRGFYHYEKEKGKTKRKEFNEEVYDLLGAPERRDMDRRGVQERLGLLMVNEAIRCLEEEILASASDGDLGAVFGLGFPPFRGGPFRLVDQEGPANVVARLERLASVHGPRFAPADLLVQNGKDGRLFY